MVYKNNCLLKLDINPGHDGNFVFVHGNSYLKSNIINEKSFIF